MLKVGVGVLLILVVGVVVCFSVFFVNLSYCLSRSLYFIVMGVF